MSGLSEAERRDIKVAIANGYHDHTATDRVVEVVERILADREANARAEVEARDSIVNYGGEAWAARAALDAVDGQEVEG